MPHIGKQPRSLGGEVFHANAAIAPAHRWPAWLALLGGAAPPLVLFFFHLGTYGLWEPDEGRYAEIAREMLVRGDYIVPHMNYVPYIEKPPLLYWLSALSMRLFGVNEFGARFINATAALVGVGAVYGFALRALDRRRAVWSSTILTTCALYALMAQVLTTDMLLTATMTIALFAFFLHWSEGGGWCWLMYLAAALAVLTKGPVGAAIPATAALAFLIGERDLRGCVGRFHLVSGSLLTLMIAAPWFIAISLRQPDFPGFYFVGEHLRRFFERNYSHGEPFYYYLPVILCGTLPWSLSLPFVRWRGIMSHPARRFCVVAVVTNLIVFSASSAKLVPYVLPAFPPLALLIADRLIVTSEARGQPLAWAGVLLAVLGLASLTVAVIANHLTSTNPMLVRSELYAGGVAFVVGGVAASVLLRNGQFIAGLGVIAATSMIGLIIASYGRIAAEPSRSYATLARTIALRAPNARLICFPRYIDSLPFYSHRRVILVGAKTELDYGANHSRDGTDYFFTSKADVIRLWNQPHRSVLIVDRGVFPTIASRLGKYEVVATDAKKIAVTQASPP